MKFRHFFDGVEVPEPEGWENVTPSIVRDKTLNGILTTIDGSFSFVEDANTFLREKFDTEGFCNLVEYKVLVSVDDGNIWTVFYEGLIFTAAVKFNELNCKALTTVNDNSFYAKINNNKSIGAKPFVPRSKTDATIDVATISEISFFNPVDGTYYANSGTHGGAGYTAYEAFKYLIAFMTDNTVEFESETFEPGGEWDGLMITCGKVLSTLQDGTSEGQFQDNFPLISFETLYKEVHKEVNIGFIIEKRGAQAVMRIESKDYFYQTSSSVTLTDIGQIITSTATDQLYSKVKVGSETVTDAVFLSGNANQLFTWFGEEEYHVVDKCNIDSTLDLVAGFIKDSDTIENEVVHQAAEHDEEIFIIKCTNQSGIYVAEQSNWLTGTPPPYYYNEVLTNSRVVERFFASIPNQLALFLSTVDNTFEATKSAADSGTNITGVIDYDDEISDPGNNYNDAVYRYTAQDTGAYTFSAELNVRIQFDATHTGPVVIRLVVTRRDALDNFIQFLELEVRQINVGGTYVLSGSVVMELTSTDYVTAAFVMTPSSDGLSTKLAGGYFKCTATPAAGGIITDFDPAKQPIIRHEFETALSYSDFLTIQSDPKKLLDFSMAGKPIRSGWIESIKYSPAKGTAKFILNSSKRINDSDNS